MKKQLIHKELSFNIIGACMEVHKGLGKEFSEVVYGGALEIEFYKREIDYSREEKFSISYNGIKLKHHYIADFVIEKSVILEIKAIESLTSSHTKQTLNYLAASKLKLGLLVNFGEDSLSYKRIVL